MFAIILDLVFLVVFKLSFCVVLIVEIIQVISCVSLLKQLFRVMVTECSTSMTTHKELEACEAKAVQFLFLLRVLLICLELIFMKYVKIKCVTVLKKNTVK